MPHVITQFCCNDAGCVAVCPADCIHPGPAEPAFATTEMLYIDPAVCIDCGACIQACPVDAIYPAEDLPADLTAYAEINALPYSATGSVFAPAATVPVMPRSLPVTEQRKLRVA